MKITIVGSGDAFGTDGRAHTCFRIDACGVTTVVDFGAGSIIAWKKLGFSCNDIDNVVISHLHGDHFGGLPFLLLDSQFAARREKPLRLIGPPGLRERLHGVLDAFYPGMGAAGWNFDLMIEEHPVPRSSMVGDLSLQTFEVLHLPNAAGIRLSDGRRTFAYSGDTAWTDKLFEIAAQADLFIVECYSGGENVPNHMVWPKLAAHLPGLTAKRIVVTHLGESALARRAEMEARGLTIAHDGQIFDL
jgi:ribonuclease BN (tRNA processing enzyme)